MPSEEQFRSSVNIHGKGARLILFNWQNRSVCVGAPRRSYVKAGRPLDWDVLSKVTLMHTSVSSLAIMKHD